VKAYTQRRRRFLRWRPALLALAAALGAAAPALAQEPPGEFQSWVIPGWTFTPGMVVGTLFDSNVAIAGDDVEGRTAGDQLLRMEPFGQLEFRSPRTTFSGGYRGSLRRYFDLSGLNGTDHHAAVNLRQRMSRRVLLFLTEAYERVATTDRLELNDLPFQRLGARHNAIVAGVDARVTRRLDASIRYENGWTRFERFTPDDLRTGGMVHGVRGDVTHRFTERLSLGGTYSLRRSHMNEGTREQMFQDAGGIVRYRVGPRTSVEGAAGVAHIDDMTNDFSQTGSFYRGGVLHQMERATIGADYDRGYKPSFGFGGSTRSDGVSGFIRMPLGRNRAYVQQSASWRRSVPLLLEGSERRTTWVNSVVGYAVQRWLRLEGYWAFTRQDTQQPGGLIDRHMVGAQVVISEPVRIR
jgi:hypothetical protein